MAHFEVKALPRPEYFNFAIDVVDYWASKSPVPTAMHWISRENLQPARELDYAYFSRQSHRIALLFEGLGIKRGDRMVIILPRVPEWWGITTAALRMGVVVCPSTTLLVEQDIKYRVQSSRATLFVGNAASVQKFARIRKYCPSVTAILQIDSEVNSRDDVYISLPAALATISADGVYKPQTPTKATDPAMIYFTSGTTGLAKMVLHNHISYPLASTITGKHWLRLKPGKTYWVLSEQGWAKAAWAFFGAWNCGASLFVEDDTGAFDPRHTLEVLHKYPITTFCAPPTVYRQLVLDDSKEYFKEHPPKSLEQCNGAGEPLNPEAIKIWHEISGLQICDGYGQTESVLVCGNFEGSPIKPGSMGKPSPGVPLSLVDDEGREVPVNEEGNIAISTSSPHYFGIFDGYLNSEGALDRPLCHMLDEKGEKMGQSWHLTGDRATRDEEGYFWFVGRSDDVINSSGYRIGPFEVESTLKQIPYVVESAVVSSPDPSRGEVVKAFIVLTSSYLDSNRSFDAVALTRDIQDFCKKNAAPYKYPRKVQFVDSSFLPKTISGKIRRKELKRAEWEGQVKGKGREVKL